MVLNREQIKEIIPHREPILLLDEAEILEPGKRLVGRYHIPTDLDVFRRHFPGNPVFPGVYTLESMGQAAGVLLLSDPRWRGKYPLFFGSETVRLYRPFKPGDTLETHVTWLEENEQKARITCLGEGYLKGELAATSKMIIAMR